MPPDPPGKLAPVAHAKNAFGILSSSPPPQSQKCCAVPVSAMISQTVQCKSKERKVRRKLPKLCDISKKVNFRRYFDALIVPISLKFLADVRNFAWHFVPQTTTFHLKFHLCTQNFAQDFVWESEISHNSSFGGAKICATFRLLE